jgi:hypothetical protein
MYKVPVRPLHSTQSYHHCRFFPLPSQSLPSIISTLSFHYSPKNPHAHHQSVPPSPNSAFLPPPTHLPSHAPIPPTQPNAIPPLRPALICSHAWHPQNAKNTTYTITAAKIDPATATPSLGSSVLPVRDGWLDRNSPARVERMMMAKTEITILEIGLDGGEGGYGGRGGVSGGMGIWGRTSSRRCPMRLRVSLWVDLGVE